MKTFVTINGASKHFTVKGGISIINVMDMFEDVEAIILYR